MTTTSLDSPITIPHDHRNAGESSRSQSNRASSLVADATTAQRAALAGVLAVAATLYLWALDATGTVNDYYAQAVSAGSNSWSAMFFGSLDTANFITVDKPPLSLWVQSASVRLFGFNTWALLVPQAIAGVGTVWLTNDAVRRIWGRWAGVTAAAALAVTPIMVAMTRSNLPDPVMILCLTAGAWMLTRALMDEDRPLPWLVGAFAMVGLGFEVKMLQAWIVLPSFGLAYLFFGPRRWVDRIRESAIAGTVTLVVSFAWAAAVELWPGNTPWIGGSEDGSVFDLIFGYNGLGRIFGQGGDGGGGGNMFDAGVSWLRMFNLDNAHQIAWLLPAALAAIVLGVAVARSTASRLVAAGITLWGGWTLTHYVVFSRAEGIYHPYYTSAMSPAIAALVGAGAIMAWQWRDRIGVVAATAATLVGSSVLAWWLFDRADWNTWVGPVATVAALLAAAAMMGGHWVGSSRLIRAGLAAGLVVVFSAMGIYSGASLASANESNGSPSAGPAGTASFGSGAAGRSAAGLPQAGGAGLVQPGAVPDDIDPDALPDRGAPPTGSDSSAIPDTGDISGDVDPSAQADAGRPVGDQVQDSAALAQWLIEQWDGETWIVAVNSTNTASPITISADGAPVMTMGGFNGSDPTPTAAELAQYVADGEVRFVLNTGSGGPGTGDSSVATERSAWVAANCTLLTDAPTDGLYDCASEDAS